MAGIGTGWGFPPQFLNKGKDVQLVTDADEIRESLEILFATTIGERLHYPDFGCDLNAFMFEEVNHALVIKLQQMILDAIYQYEPRIEVQQVEITESEEDAFVLLINIDYVIIATKSNQSMVYPVTIQ